MPPGCSLTVTKLAFLGSGKLSARVEESIVPDTVLLKPSPWGKLRVMFDSLMTPVKPPCRESTDWLSVFRKETSMVPCTVSPVRVYWTRSTESPAEPTHEFDGTSSLPLRPTV